MKDCLFVSVLNSSYNVWICCEQKSEKLWICTKVNKIKSQERSTLKAASN